MWGGGGHSLSPSYKGAKSVGGTLCPLLIREQRVWGTLFAPLIRRGQRVSPDKECGGHSLSPSYKGAKSVGGTLRPLLISEQRVRGTLFAPL